MDPVGLTCVVRSLGGSPLVEVDGELSARALEEFERALSEACGCDGDLVVLDLTRVKSLDARALRLLVQAHERLRPGKRMCAVACGRARAVLEMTRLDEVIGLYSRVQDVPRQ